MSRTELPAASSALSILRQPNMRWLFIGNLVSNIGTWFQNIAGAAVMFELTDSSGWVGAMNFALFGGALFLAPWTGNAADRWDRRKLLIASQVVSATVAGILAIMTATGRLDQWVLLAASALLGLSIAFMAPAILALVPLLVSADDLEPAVSLNSVSFNLGRAIGPVLGAGVLAGLGAAWAFGLNSLTFVIFVLLLLLVRPRPQVRITTESPRLRDALRDVRGQRLLVVLLTLTGLISLSTDPIFTLTAEMAQDVLGGTEATIGILVGAFGIGATITALFLLGWISQRRFALAGSMTALGIGILGFAWSTSVPMAIVSLAIGGGGFLASLTRVTARLQVEIPDEQRGRIMAIWTVMFVGTRPISAPLDGLLADLISPRFGATVFALPALLGAAWAWRLVRDS
ncbi:MAG: MFS transporter [Nitriliruptorales bacterium]|nr:MFS transporter [Nitriliruptorales bacterium]